MSKISELSDGGSLQSTDYLIAVRSGGNVKVRPNGSLTLGTLTLDGLTVDTNTLHVDATNNRVGIGTTSPSTQLQIVGSTFAIMRLSAAAGDNNARVDFGTSASPDIGRIGYNNSTNALTFRTNGADAVTIDSSQNVGIGTTSPGSFFSGANQLVVGSGSGAQGITIYAASNDNSQIFFADGTSGADAYRGIVRYLHNDNAMAFYTDGANERMRIDSSGILSFSETSTASFPARSINAYNNGYTYITGGANGIVLKDASASGSRVQVNAATIQFEANGSERARIDSSGNLIVGGTETNSIPTLARGIYVQSQTNDDVIGYSLYVSEGANNRRGSFFLDDSAGVYGFDSTASSGVPDFVVRSAGSEAMRIDSSGNLLVGKTSVGATIAGTEIKSNGQLNCALSSGNDFLNMYSTTASAYRFYITNAGQIHATSTSISSISDASLKENVRDLDKGLDTILALKPRRFDWKNGDGNDIMGFVAQEVQEALPELVHDYKYNDSETKLGIKMGDMIPSLVKAIQEQQEIINDLRARVAQLEGA